MGLQDSPGSSLMHVDTALLKKKIFKIFWDEGMEMEDALVSPFEDISRLAAERAVQIGTLQTKGLLSLHRGPIADAPRGPSVPDQDGRPK
ncbi:unnamed protein product [Ixodes pacificus]